MDRDWSKIRWFSKSEFASPDSPESHKYMRWDVVEFINALRSEVGFPIKITSAVRTPSHNANVGGVSNSSHLSTREGGACALDIYHGGNSFRLFAILRYCLNHGVTRIGIGFSFVHIDFDERKNPRRAWLYYPGKKLVKKLQSLIKRDQIKIQSVDDWDR